MFHFIVCDKDEEFCRKEKRFIAEYYQRLGIRTEISVYHSGEEIIALGEKLSDMDAIFLDINLEEVNGIDLGNWLNGAVPKLIIVFVSGQIGYAPHGYRVGAARFIVKDEEQFENSMEECLQYLLKKTGDGESGYISIAEEKIRISIEKILYVESSAHRITYHLMKNSDTREEYTVYGKLDDAERELAGFGFCRVHKSFLVNMNYVQNVQRYDAVLLNGICIRISKGKYKEVEAAFIRTKGTF